MSRRGSRLRISGIAACVVGSALAVGASAASAVTVGEMALMEPGSTCDGGIDAVTPDAGTGNGYAVPSTGGIGSWTLTSWSTNASSDPAQSMTLKIFRKVGDPATFQALSHDVRHDLHPDINTFAASLQVSSGDLIGFHYDATTAGGGCGFVASGMSAVTIGNLADRASAAFTPIANFRLNLSAQVTPTNAFTLGEPKAKANGTAKLTVSVPNPGDLKVSGNGVKASSAGAIAAKHVSAAGTVKLVIRAKGRKKQRLASSGKVSVRAKISFTPTGGVANVESRKVKLHHG